jgi:ParB family chromosome partitioning protein
MNDQRKTVEPALGRGLAALFDDDEDVLDAIESKDSVDISADDATTQSNRRNMPVSWLEPCPFQPRKHFDTDAIEELASSLSAHGVLQPILVRPQTDNSERYEIIAGERRWRAAQKAQLHEVPVIIKYLTDTQVLELALIENLQREDLSPLEEARAYKQLMEEYAYTQEKLAAAMGKSRSYVANILRLLSLPDSVQSMVADQSLSAGHARALIGAKDPEFLAQKIVKEGLNVRQTEGLARFDKAEQKRGAGQKQSKLDLRKSAPSADSEPKKKSVDVLALEKELSQLLGLNVEVEQKGIGGVLSVSYANLDQLDDILHRLSYNPGKIV